MLNYETIIGRAKYLFTTEKKEMKSCIEQAVNEIVTNEEISELASLLDVTKDNLIKDICKKCEEKASKECKKCAELEKQISEYADSLSRVLLENATLVDKLAKKEGLLNSAQIGEQFALKCCNEARELLAEKEKEIELLKQDRSNLFREWKNTRSTFCNMAKVGLRSLIEALAGSLVTYCIWNKKNEGDNCNIFQNMIRTINAREARALELFDERLNRIEKGEII